MSFLLVYYVGVLTLVYLIKYRPGLVNSALILDCAHFQDNLKKRRASLGTIVLWPIALIFSVVWTIFWIGLCYLIIWSSRFTEWLHRDSSLLTVLPEDFYIINIEQEVNSEFSFRTGEHRVYSPLIELLHNDVVYFYRPKIFFTNEGSYTTWKELQMCKRNLSTIVIQAE